MVGPTFKDHPTYPYIGDRVIVTSNSHKHVPFGVTGTVIGTYKMHIEILFDEPFIGGTDLNGRCPPFRGGVMFFFDIFDLTMWPEQINTRELMMKLAQRLHNFRPIEWDGRIDLSLILKRLSQTKRQYEK